MLQRGGRGRMCNLRKYRIILQPGQFTCGIPIHQLKISRNGSSVTGYLKDARGLHSLLPPKVFGDTNASLDDGVSPMNSITHVFRKLQQLQVNTNASKKRKLLSKEEM